MSNNNTSERTETIIKHINNNIDDNAIAEFKQTCNSDNHELRNEKLIGLLVSNISDADRIKLKKMFSDPKDEPVRYNIEVNIEAQNACTRLPQKKGKPNSK